METAVFRFDAANHEYINPDTGLVYPHITGMLEASGWIDDRWYTEESSARGTAVHRLTADYDLGALDPSTCVSIWRGYLLAHVHVMKMLQAQGLEVLTVEEPVVHPSLQFGGRPDREIRLAGAVGVLDGKTGAKEKSHQIQTALQAILIAPKHRIRPEAILRYALYWKDNGKAKLEPHRDPADYIEARKVIRQCCGR